MTESTSPMESLRWYADVAIYELLRQISPWSVRRPSLQSWLGRNYNRARRLLGNVSDEDPWHSNSKQSVFCEHSDHGVRAAPWGKLAAIEATLATGYDTVVYIDSDAFFSETTTSIAHFIENSESQSAPLQSADLTVLHSVPFKNEEANSGFMIWRNTPSARRLLAEWWHTDGGSYHQHHDYEQSVLKQTLLVNPITRTRIAIVQDDCFIEHKGQFIRHVASPHAVQRVPRFRSAAAKAGLTEIRFQQLMAKIRSQHLRAINCTEVRFASE